MKPSELVEGFYDLDADREPGISYEELKDVLRERMQYIYPDIVAKADPRLFDDALGYTASFHEGAEEIGSSDMNIMLRQVIKYIEQESSADKFAIGEARHYVDESVTEDRYTDAWAKEKAAANRARMEKEKKQRERAIGMKPFLNPRQLSAKETVARLSRMGEQMVGDWYLNGGYDSVRDGIIDMANDHRIPWDAKIINAVMRSWNLKPGDMPEEMTEGTDNAQCPSCHSADIKTYSDGEKECNHCHRTWDVQGVAAGAEEDRYSDEFVQSQIDYYAKHILSGNTSDRLRINGSLNYYRHIKNKRIKDGAWSLEQGVAEDRYTDAWAKKLAATNKARKDQSRADHRAHMASLKQQEADQKAAEKARLERVLQNMAMDITSFAGEVFPDADPYEMLAQKYRAYDRAGNLIKMLDKAARKHLGAKSYNDALADLYDQQASDSPEQWGHLGGKGNPFRESISETYGAPHVHIGAQVYVKGQEEGEPLTVIGVVDDQQVRVKDEYLNKQVVMIRDLVPANAEQTTEAKAPWDEPNSYEPPAEIVSKIKELGFVPDADNQDMNSKAEMAWKARDFDKLKYKELYKFLKSIGFSNTESRAYRTRGGQHVNLDDGKSNWIQLGYDRGMSYVSAQFTKAFTEEIVESKGARILAIQKRADALWRKYSSPRNTGRMNAEDMIGLIDLIAGGRTYMFTNEIERIPGAKTMMAAVNDMATPNHERFLKGLAIMTKALDKGRGPGLRESKWKQEADGEAYARLLGLSDRLGKAVEKTQAKWTEPTWDEQRAAAITRLEKSIRRMQDDGGWSGLGTGFGGGTYNRDWKKDISAAKRRLAKMKRGEGERADGSDLDESKSAILEGLKLY